jgi:hypothetical protein
VRPRRSHLSLSRHKTVGAPPVFVDVFARLTKMDGGQDLGSIGDGVSPSSGDVAKSGEVSAQADRLKAGSVYTDRPFGSTNVPPVARARARARRTEQGEA